MSDKTLPQQDNDRRLLADVHRWARTNGWVNTWRGWADDGGLERARVAVTPHAESKAFYVAWRKGNGGWHGRVRYEAFDVRQAVDLLVALNILPAHFSSAYAAGAESTREVIEAARTLAEAFDFGSHSAQDAAVQALGDAVAAYEIDDAGSAR